MDLLYVLNFINNDDNIIYIYLLFKLNAIFQAKKCHNYTFAK